MGFLYKTVNGKVAEHLERPWTSTRRNHNQQLRTIGANSDAYNTIPVWNNLNHDIVNSASFEQFKARLKDNNILINHLVKPFLEELIQFEVIQYYTDTDMEYQ